MLSGNGDDAGGLFAGGRAGGLASLTPPPGAGSLRRAESDTLKKSVNDPGAFAAEGNGDPEFVADGTLLNSFFFVAAFDAAMNSFVISPGSSAPGFAPGAEGAAGPAGGTIIGPLGTEPEAPSDAASREEPARGACPDPGGDVPSSLNSRVNSPGD
jgi:hypothetical protein